MRLPLFAWVLFPFMAGWMAAVYVNIVQATQWQTNRQKFLEAMNTVWDLIYRLTEGCVVLVSQCCGAELGRRSSGSRYHFHLILQLCCSLYRSSLFYFIFYSSLYHTLFWDYWHVNTRRSVNVQLKQNWTRWIICENAVRTQIAEWVCWISRTPAKS